MTNKNSFIVSIDSDWDSSQDEAEQDKREFSLHVTVHTLVKGKVNETHNAELKVKGDMGFSDLWKKIGDEITTHMTDNPAYHAFGS